MCEPHVYLGIAEAGATALNETGIVVSASASATATSTISQMDADEKAYQIALKDAQSQAENSSNIMTQGTEVTFATIEQGGATGIYQNESAIFSNFGISLPDFGKNLKKQELLELQHVNWLAIAMSSDGKYQTAGTAEYGAGVFNSTDYGNTWVLNKTFTEAANIKSAAMTSSGDYQVIVADNLLWVSQDYGQTWTKSSSGIPFSKISISFDGKYQTGIYASIFGDYRCYTSSDFGVTWTDITDLFTNARFSSVALSSSGQYQTIVCLIYCDGGGCTKFAGIWRSSDYGNTWTENVQPEIITVACSNVALSSSGEFQTAVSDYEGGILTSSDYGVTWKKNDGTEKVRRWVSISMNSLGNIQTATGGAINTTTADGPYNVWNSTDYGKTWIKNETLDISISYNFSAISSTGEYQTITSEGKGIWSSSNYGTTYSKNADLVIYPLILDVQNVAISASGQYQTASVSLNSDTNFIAGLNVSSDYGKTWSDNKIPGVDYLSGWALAMSSSGQFQTAGFESYGIWYSNNFGNDWVQSPGTTDNPETGRQYNWVSTAMSSSGEFQTAISSDIGGIWNSTDYGETWKKNTNIPIPPSESGPYFNVVSTNSSGQYQTVVSNNFDGIWTSVDYGNNWTQNTKTTNYIWQSVSMSSSGKFQTAVENETAYGIYGGGIWTSIDYGNTWSKNETLGTTSSNWTSISVSSTGQYQFATSQYQGYGSYGIWYSSDFGHSWSLIEGTESIECICSAISSSGQYATFGSRFGWLWTSNNPLTPPGVNYGDYLFWNETNWSVGSTSLSIGYQSGKTGQTDYSVALGYQAGQFEQGAIGSDDGQTGYSVAIGYQSGQIGQESKTVAIGFQAGQIGQQEHSVSIGEQCGQTAQSPLSIAIGFQAGQDSQGQAAGPDATPGASIAIGYQAGQIGQSQSAIAFGANAGQINQKDQSIAVGSGAGYTEQGEFAIAVGFGAGQTNQTTNAIAIGQNAGFTDQSPDSISIGFQAGQESQGQTSFLEEEPGRAIAIGYQAGQIGQSPAALAIGYLAGQTNQKDCTVAIGFNAGNAGQELYAVTIGVNSGEINQQFGAVSIGGNAGRFEQGECGTSVGAGAGFANQGAKAVAVGYHTGYTGQGQYAVAIGNDAGRVSQGSYSIAIGFEAGCTAQVENSIVINASKTAINGNTSGFYVAPIRGTSSSKRVLQYDEETNEMTYSSTVQTNSCLTTVELVPPTSSTPGVIGQQIWCDKNLYLYVGKWVRVPTFDV